MKEITTLKQLKKEVARFFLTQDIEAETLIDDGDLFVWVSEVNEDTMTFINSVPGTFTRSVKDSIQKEGMKLILFTQTF